MMDGLILLAQVGGEKPTGEIARMFGLNWPHLTAQMISFGIVCLVLYKFAYKPVLAMLEERRQRIAQSMADTEKIKAELAKIEAQQREAIAKVNAQAVKLIEEAREAAARVQQQETQKAVAAAEQIIAKAREAAAQDHDRMLVELKREVGRLVVKATTAVTGKILTPEDQRRLAEETARQVAN
jgi:F-type H+-transporting ATPase subunit b